MAVLYLALLVSIALSVEGGKSNCPIGFDEVAGHCYLLSQKQNEAPKTEQEARIYCLTEADGSELANLPEADGSDGNPLLQFIHENGYASDSGLYLGAEKGETEW